MTEWIVAIHVMIFPQIKMGSHLPMDPIPPSELLIWGKIWSQKKDDVRRFILNNCDISAQ